MTPDVELIPSRHWLIVGAWIRDEERPEWEIEHETCELSETEGRFVASYDCAVQYQIDGAGIDAFGMSTSGAADAWRTDPWPKGLPTKPGRYEIEFWSVTFPGGPWGPTEYDAGLTLVEEHL